ncbi:MAG TPA: glycosyltransferase family 4 protein [Thermoanaerobaculia bacterium]|nr:glycosyltransferase family 4 protein [Thermoanaerobaculia bacterium]
MVTVEPLKIVHVAATATGAPWMIALMAEQKRLGHDVAAIIPAIDGGIGAQLHALGIPCHVAGVDILFAVPGVMRKTTALLRLARLLRRLRPDVVHSHIVNSVVTARLASWIADVPVHLGANAHPYSMESDILGPIEAGTSFCDTVTIASCTHTRELMLRHALPEKQIELIYYAVDQSRHDPALADGSRVRQELGIAPGTPVIGKIAYFYPPANAPGLVPSPLLGRGIKGHEVLIRAIPSVLGSFPDARFILVGRGWGQGGPAYEQELKELVNRLGVSSFTLFPGERSDIPDVLAALDISVQCSLSDNLGGTVESLLMARPLVVSDIRGFADTVRHEETGLVVPVDDPAALAAALVRLLRDRDLGRRLGENGRRLMLDRFTLARAVTDTEQLLAAMRQPADRHYRIAVSIWRAIALPVRLLPMCLGVYRGMRRHGFSIPRFVRRRVQHAIGRCIASLRRSWRVAASGPS